MNLLFNYASVDILNFTTCQTFMREQPKNVIKPEKTTRARTKRVNMKQAVLRER